MINFNSEQIGIHTNLIFGVGSLKKNRAYTLCLLLCLTWAGLHAQTFRVMSFNILDGGQERLDTIFYIISQQKADIVLIQESSNLDDRFALKAAAYGYNVIQNSLDKGIFQPAILSKYKIISHESLFRSIQAVIELPGGTKLKVHNAHWLPLELNQERIFQTKHLVREHLIYDRENYPIITGGDFNVWPNQQEVLGQFTQVGFKQDVFDRLDYLYSHGLTSIQGSAKVLGGTGWPSDHTSVMVDYEVPGGFIAHSKTFTLTNNFKKSIAFKTYHFTDNFPMGNLKEIKFISTGTKGKLYYENTAIESNNVISINEVNKIRYENTLIGIDEIEWLGVSTSGAAKHSSFIKIENTATIQSFDRAKCLYDVDFLNARTRLYFGNSDIFSSVSFDSLAGAEFVKFPTFISHFGNPALANYFSLELNTPSTLYLAFDNRNIAPANWVTENFTATDITFTSNEHSYKVFKKSVPAGKFNFGSNNYMNWPQRAFVDHFIFIVLPHKTIVGLNEQLSAPNELRVSVFPNPTTDNITIDLGREYEHAEITFLDSFGNTIKETTYQACRYVREELVAPAGVYLIKVNAANRTEFIRFVKPN